MKWKKAPEWLVERFHQLVPEGDARVERRKMFGYPCAFAAGNMFIGLCQDQLVLRLPEPARERFLAEAETDVFSPFPGRVMREYAVVPHTWLEPSRGEELAGWIAQSLEYAGSLTRRRARKR